MPQFGINPGLLQQLAQGNGINPGEAIMQGLAWGQERQQNAMTNQLNQRKLDLAEKRTRLSELDYERKLKELKNKVQTRILTPEEATKKGFDEGDVVQVSDSGYKVLQDRGGDDERNVVDRYMDVGGRQVPVNKYGQVIESAPVFESSEDTEYGKGGVVLDKDGNRLGRAVWDDTNGQYVWEGDKTPVPEDMEVISTSVQSPSIEGAMGFSDKTKEEAGEQLVNIALLEEHLQKAKEYIKTNPNVAGLPGSLARNIVEPIAAGVEFVGGEGLADKIDKAADVEGAVKFEVLGEIIVSDFIEPVTKEEGRFSDRDMERVKTVGSILRSTRRPSTVLDQIEELEKVVVTPDRLRQEIKAGKAKKETIAEYYQDGKIYRSTAEHLLRNFYGDQFE